MVIHVFQHADDENTETPSNTQGVYLAAVSGSLRRPILSNSQICKLETVGQGKHCPRVVANLLQEQQNCGKDRTCQCEFVTSLHDPVSYLLVIFKCEKHCPICPIVHRCAQKSLRNIAELNVSFRNNDFKKARLTTIAMEDR